MTSYYSKSSNPDKKWFGITNRKGAFVAAFILFYTMMPYFFWSSTFNNPYVKTILLFVLGYLFFREYENKRKGNRMLLGYFLIIILYNVLNNDYTFLYALSFFPLAFLPFARDEFHNSVYENFLTLYTFILAIGLVIWTLYLLGVLHPYSSIQPLNELKNYNYSVYPFLLVDPTDVIRFCGVFDEPGVVGTASGIFLCTQRFNLKDKRSWILLISGVSSLSLFFFVLIGGYFFFYFILKKSVKKIILFAGFVIVSLLVISKVEVLNDTIGSRLKWNKGEGLAGDNRMSEDGKFYFNSIIGTDVFWFGVDDKDGYREMVEGTSSIMNTIVINGLVFVLLYLSFYVSYGLQRKQSTPDFLLYLMVILCTIYQRPFLFEAVFIFQWISLGRRQSMIIT